MTNLSLTYASDCDTKLSRLSIRAIEVLTGQTRLKRLYDIYEAEMKGSVDFWEAAMRLLELSLDYDSAKLAKLPATGSLVIVANHPFGLVDGILIGHLANRVRRDFKVLTNARLYPPDADIQQFILPIDFDPTPEAKEVTLRTRAIARQHLMAGGCLVVFPAGGVATTPTPFAKRAIDDDWKPFTARLIHAAKADVVPMFFHGQNSRLFQIASHISMTARLAFLLHEVANKIGDDFRVSIGDVLPYAAIQPMRDPQELSRYLRARTEWLGNPAARPGFSGIIA
ncbi:lysophospholipid acyltransferase family protein [Dongia sp.]|uniref:lysophospholipid acyltransferase family protein n=1 Tax=Dongia sp. TaxID=1977262 RepID=UPI0035B30FEA